MGYLNYSQTYSFQDLCREKEYSIMKLLSKGCPNKEILEKLYMSEGTIRNIV